MDTSRQVGQVVVDPGRTECTVRGATELGVMPGDDVTLLKKMKALFLQTKICEAHK